MAREGSPQKTKARCAAQEMLKQLLPAPTNALQDEFLDDLDDVDGSSKIIADSTAVSGTVSSLPAPPKSFNASASNSQSTGVRRAPPYLQRSNWIPRDVDDFDGGGAFPEIHVPQYPLKMGSKEASTTGAIIPLEVDETGKVRYDALVRNGARKNTWVHSSFKDMVEKVVDDEELQKPTEDDIAETTERTRKQLESLVSTRIQASKAKSNAINTATSQKKGPTYVRYTPQQSSGSHNSGATQRIISLVETQRDPLEPPRHQHKRVPGGIPSPPPPVQHSPPRKLTAQDQQNWKIPSSISNWKNPKGYTIPLDKRMAADGSGMQDTQLNNNFGQFMEALYIAERNARDEVRKRNELQKMKQTKEKDAHEQMLRDLAARTRMERAEISE
jgi:SNW domain-containing protein 1